jgi:zinc transport system substrate-binding protein
MSRRQRPSLIVAALVLSSLGIPFAAPARPKVITTISPLFCFAKNVAGSAADVENLLPVGASAHDHQLSPRDRGKLDAAQLIIFNGLEVEGVLEEKLRERDKPATVDAAEGLDKRLITASHKQTSASNPTGANPHFWLDPTLGAHAVSNIIRALAKVDPAHAAAYQSNGIAYVQRLHMLDKEISTELAPFKGAPLVTQHDAFPYFARRYGLEIVGVIQMVPEVNPSPKYLSALQRTIRGKKVRVIFTEPNAASAHAERIAHDLKVKLAPLDPLESVELTASAYEDALRLNAKTLKGVLDAPLP